MSLNRFMHPRNKYRKPPDFKALAIKYEEFRKHAKQDITGKVSLNFKDLEAIRSLTRTLLLEDFNLDVEIPPSRLVPTLPLRLNYLLWIEDLLTFNNRKLDDVTGIDIGCGASCVYPLLAAKQFGWKMLATEVDMESAFIAGRNVKKNKLETKITVRSVKEGEMLVGVVKTTSETTSEYDFCMCNPPFFSSTDELDPKNVSRTANRPQPRNAHSGTTTELVAPGGETAFVAAIIRDSVQLKAAVRIYTVMLGHKTSVSRVKKELEEAGVSTSSITTTEFCQGHTTRWGIAWTLDTSVSFPPPTDLSPLKKKIGTLSQTFQSTLKCTVARLQELMEQLKITYKVLKSTKDLCAMEITALENTWSNSRKKRRQEKLQTIDESKETNTCDILQDNGKNNKSDIFLEDNIVDSSQEHKKINENDNKKVSCEEEGKRTVTEKSEEKLDKTGDREEEVVSKGIKRSLAEGDVPETTNNTEPSKKPKLETATSSANGEEHSSKEPILHGSLVVKKGSVECTVEMARLSGFGGKDSLNQVLQYFRNHFKTTLGSK